MANRKLNSKQIEEIKSFRGNKDSTSKECLRALAVLLIDMGSVDLVKDLTGYTREYAFELRRLYLKQGIRALITKKPRERHLLAKGELAEIDHMIRTKTPEQLGFVGQSSWTINILGKAIFDFYGVKYKSRTSLYLIFKAAKFTYHKPGMVYKNRKQAVIDQWDREKLPIILEHLKDKDTVVLAEDEMILTTQTTTQQMWLASGVYPKIEVSNVRKRRSIYGFLNTKTGREHAFKTEKQTGDVTIDILEKICKEYLGKKIVIVWDNAPWHRSKVLKEYLAVTKHNIELIAFPPYDPEKNPQEHVWKAGRSLVTHNKFIENIDKATDELIAIINNTVFEYSFCGVKKN